VIGALARDRPARGLPAAWRANFTACSLASAPPSVKKTRAPAPPTIVGAFHSVWRHQVCNTVRASGSIFLTLSRLKRL
jgi:hypothetical protein